MYPFLAVCIHILRSQSLSYNFFLLICDLTKTVKAGVALDTSSILAPQNQMLWAKGSRILG